MANSLLNFDSHQFLNSRQLTIIQKNIAKKRILNDINMIDTNLYSISVDVDHNNLTLIIFTHKINKQKYSIILNINYPFQPPIVKINDRLYKDFLIIHSIPTLNQLSLHYNIDCLCCRSITCLNNWTPIMGINHIISEIETYKNYRINIIYRLLSSKIKNKYLINDINLESWF
jgi:ubiquitin-protein ligase